MRPPGAALLALAVAAAALVAAGGLLFTRTGLGPPETARPIAGELPLGRFIPATPSKPAPQVSFTDASGRTASLASFDGKVVLLNLWATWCAPCRREMPSLQRLQTRFGDKLAVLAVSEDLGGDKIVAPFVAKLGLNTIRFYLDPKSTVGRAFKVDGLPTSFLIDRKGRVLGRVEGEADWLSPTMLAAIEPLVSANDLVKTSLPSVHP